eukprot:scaffold2418_cov58-Cyclotella_meneghiniana.AAC.20
MEKQHLSQPIQSISARHHTSFANLTGIILQSSRESVTGVQGCKPVICQVFILIKMRCQWPINNLILGAGSLKEATGALADNW